VKPRRITVKRHKDKDRAMYRYREERFVDAWNHISTYAAAENPDGRVHKSMALASGLSDDGSTTRCLGRAFNVVLDSVPFVLST
jgi:hypothetical protein